MKKIEKAQNQLRESVKGQDMSKIIEDNKTFTVELQNELDTNAEYSLIVDPMNRYNLSDKQKEFINNYINTKSIPLAAELSEISIDTAKKYFTSYATKQEIKRINRAIYQRRFSNKLLSLDQIAGYLTSYITEEDVPLAEQVKPMEKVRIIQMLIDLNILKQNSINNPNIIMNTDIESEIKNLSVKSIRELIYQANLKAGKNDKLTNEEEAFLNTLSSKELLSIVDSTNKEEK